jgi:hypothetical protein
MACGQSGVPNDWQDYPGNLNFTLDSWTSLNHRAYIAIVVHYVKDGKPVSHLLDVVEVAEVS